MALNYNKICFYDFETDNIDPTIANPTELAAKVYDARKLEPIPDAEFVSGIQPPDINEENYKEKHLSTLEFHAKNKKCTVDEVIALYKTYPAEKIVWEQFKEFTKKYNNDQKNFSKLSGPIRGGWNIVAFDNIILERLANKYGDIDKEGKQKLFTPRHVIDGLHLCFYWFEGLAEDAPDRYNLDDLRVYFGMSDEASHTAIFDVIQSADIITRFMRLHRKYAPGVGFKGAMKSA